jgi:hypothetical protein
MTRQRRFVLDGVIADVVDEEDDFGGGRHRCGDRRELLYPAMRILRKLGH